MSLIFGVYFVHRKITTQTTRRLPDVRDIHIDINTNINFNGKKRLMVFPDMLDFPSFRHSCFLSVFSPGCVAHTAAVSRVASRPTTGQQARPRLRISARKRDPSPTWTRITPLLGLCFQCSALGGGGDMVFFNRVLVTLFCPGPPLPTV